MSWIRWGQVSDDAKPVEIIRTLSFRAARKRYKISYEVWKSIKSGAVKEWSPFRGGYCTEDGVQDVLDSVRKDPALATRPRAAKLGRRTETIQIILKTQGLNRLHARLKYAGYSVDVTRPLARARQHRILACGPGVYTNVDFKRLGALRRLEPGDRQTHSQQFCGLQCVDAYSGFASVHVCPEEDADAAVAGLQRYVENATFKVKGLVLTDNGLCFLSDPFIGYLATHAFTQRTTKYHHPWSNGKVESFNRTLKYQAMPALVAAGCQGYAQVQAWLNKWLVYYNTKRYHGGWINKGLPPQTVIDMWSKSTGDAVTRLVSLGHIKPDEVNRTRVMGSGKHAVDLGLERGTPFALVIEALPLPMRPELPMGWTLPK